MNHILSYSPGESLLHGPRRRSTLLFDEVYDIDEVINEGCYGTVFKAYHKATEEVFAAKILNRVDQRSDEIILNEVSMLYELKDMPNIIQLVDFFMDDDYMYIIQDYARGGDVMDQLIERGKFDEIDACNLMNVLLQTVRTLHNDCNIVHRDIKPDNILLKDPNDYSSLQLCDFGFATYLPESKNASLSRRCGSLAYTAPEIVQKKKYRQQVDMWSIGCTLFLLLSGYQAFEDKESSKTCANIKRCLYCVDDTMWDTISDEAKEMIENLLVLDPDQRWTTDQAIECAWITKNIDSKMRKKY